MVFESLGRLYLKSGDALPERLTRDSSTAMEYSPVWAPDGRSVYFLRWDDAELSSIHSVNVRNGRTRSIFGRRGQFDSLAVSADGKRLTFRKLAGSAFLHPEFAVEPGIYVLDIASGEARRIRNTGSRPRFAGARVHVVDRQRPAGRGSDTAKTQLISLSLDGLDERLLAESEHGSDIQLSPDGRYIAFTENFDLYVAAFTRSSKKLSIGRQRKGFPVRRVSMDGALYLHWSSEGNALSWSSGPKMRTVAVTDEWLLADEPIDATARDLSMAVASAKPTGTIALTEARVITMDAERQVIENGVIVVEDNRITAVGTADDVTIPPAADVLSIAGKTVIPGLIDAHAHGPYGRGDIIPEQNWSALAHLALGVTTLQDPSSNASLVFAAAEYARAGRILAPRIFSTGNIVYGARGRAGRRSIRCPTPRAISIDWCHKGRPASRTTTSHAAISASR